MNKKLIIINSFPPTTRFCNKLDTYRLNKNGLIVEYWDLSFLFFDKTSIQSFFSSSNQKFIGPNHKEIYNIVLESQLSGIAKARAGVTGAEVDAACRNVIEKAGFGDKFIHSTGHGLGLEVHTYPRLSSFNKEPLKENYVVTIEPGIYLAGWGGVRIEDDCLITKESCLPLNKSTKEMLILN